MLVPQSPGNWGLGVELRKSGADSWFMHTGENEGYLAIVAGLPSRCSGLAVMMNGDGGAGLLREVVAAVTKAHGWPQIIPTTTLRPLDAAKAKQLAGTFSVAAPPMSFDIKAGERGGPEFFLKGASRGRIFADATGRILVVTADLAPLAEVRT